MSATLHFLRLALSCPMGALLQLITMCPSVFIAVKDFAVPWVSLRWTRSSLRANLFLLPLRLTLVEDGDNFAETIDLLIGTRRHSSRRIYSAEMLNSGICIRCWLGRMQFSSRKPTAPGEVTRLGDRLRVAEHGGLPGPPLATQGSASSSRPLFSNTLMRTRLGRSFGQAGRACYRSLARKAHWT